MPAAYLKQLTFSWDSSGFPTDSKGRIHSDHVETASRIEDARRYMPLALCAWISHELRQAKAVIPGPKITSADICLTPNPAPGATYDKPAGTLRVEVGFDPHALLDLPDDPINAGQLLLDLTEKGLRKLEAWAGFPSTPISAACDRFREHGHAYRFRVGEKIIPGTRVKGRISAAVTCLSTTKHLTLLYRNKACCTLKLSESEQPDMAASRVFSGFDLDGDRLTALVGPVLMELRGEPLYANGARPVTIDLWDHPEAQALISQHRIR